MLVANVQHNDVILNPQSDPKESGPCWGTFHIETGVSMRGGTVVISGEHGPHATAGAPIHFMAIDLAGELNGNPLIVDKTCMPKDCWEYLVDQKHTTTQTAQGKMNLNVMCSTHIDNSKSGTMEANFEFTDDTARTLSTAMINKEDLKVLDDKELKDMVMDGMKADPSFLSTVSDIIRDFTPDKWNAVLFYKAQYSSDGSTFRNTTFTDKPQGKIMQLINLFKIPNEENGRLQWVELNSMGEQVSVTNTKYTWQKHGNTKKDHVGQPTYQMDDAFFRKVQGWVTSLRSLIASRTRIKICYFISTVEQRRAMCATNFSMMINVKSPKVKREKQEERTDVHGASKM